PLLVRPRTFHGARLGCAACCLCGSLSLRRLRASFCRQLLLCLLHGRSGLDAFLPRLPSRLLGSLSQFSVAGRGCAAGCLSALTGYCWLSFGRLEVTPH